MMTYSRCLGVCRALSQEIFLHRTYPRPRYLHSSVILCKKRKSREERKNPQPIVYVAKSKFKKGTPVEVWHNMTIKDLAKTLDKDTDHVFEVMTFIDNTAKYRRDNDVINNFKIIEEVVKKSGHRCQIVPEPGEEVEKEFKDATRRNPSEYVDPRPRPPVVAIMGHVDHGKTTLLDTLRKSSIVDKEFGGITQHIGAFSVSIGKDKVTFLDTPGHAAFISMRSRGAHSTDIVVLVVAADDGVMEQTIESINMAKEANVPIIAAINKIDKPQADVERAKKMLMTYGILAEDYGGDVQMVPISALKGTNVDKLMEAILAQAEVMGLQSDYEGPVEGVIVESSTDTHRGKLGTVLVQCGTLKKGAVLVAGTTTCKVRAMFNDQGVPMASATPSTPVEILGWRDIPSAGDVLIEVSNEREATRIAHHRAQIEQEKKASESYTEIEKKAMEHYAKYREQLEIKRKAGRFKMKRSGPREKEIKDDDSGPRVNVVIKGDVDGSIEAILDVLGTYDNPKCRLDIVHYGVGPVSKNDFVLAESFNAIVYTFNTKLLEPAPDNVPVRNHNVIYRLVDDIKSEINERLPKLVVEELVGEANVLQEFLINEGKHKIPVAGCRCVKGSLKKSSRFKLVRGQEVIYDGQVSSLRHLKDEVDTIKKDLECGIRLADPSVRFNAGDTLVCYKINKVSDSIEWDPGF